MGARKKGPKRAQPEVGIPSDRFTIMQVAQTLKCRYQRARDYMLQGVFGETQYTGLDRKLTVDREKVLQYKKQQDEKQAPAAS